MAGKTSTVVGVFPDNSWAQRAIQALQSAGFKARMADASIAGRLASMGIDRNAASLYKSRLDEGDAVVIVEDAGNRGEDALGAMLQNGSENIDLSKGNTGAAAKSSSTTTTTATQPTDDATYYQDVQKRPKTERMYGQHDQTTGRARTQDEMRVLLREETLTPVKQAVQAGEVELRKVVHEKQEQVPVTLRHEEVVIERHAVDRPLQSGEGIDMKNEVIEVPVYEERAELQKQARITEEVGLSKRAVEEQQTLTGKTRHEHLEAVQSGDVEIVGDTGIDVRTTQNSQQTSTSQSQTNQQKKNKR